MVVVKGLKAASADSMRRERREADTVFALVFSELGALARCVKSSTVFQTSKASTMRR